MAQLCFADLSAKLGFFRIFWAMLTRRAIEILWNYFILALSKSEIAGLIDAYAKESSDIVDFGNTQDVI